MARKTLTRPLLILIAVLLVGGGLAWAFWPRPVMVDVGTVTRGPMMLTIDGEGHTRVAEAFTVSTPIDGRLQRVEVHPGDPVRKDATVVARMRPANPAALDARTREQAQAAVVAAQAGLRVAEAALEAAQAEADLAETDLARTERLARSGTVSEAALDRAQGAARAAEARLHTAEAAIAQRRAEVQSAQAHLIGIDDPGLLRALEDRLDDKMPIYAPADGVILRVIHENETTLPAGSPILEIGNIRDDLEVVVDLLSSDAVTVSSGDPVIIENWGRDAALAGIVTRIDPFAETRVSALGVEEQRVTVVVRLTTPPERRDGLGHGFSVDVRVVVWQEDETLRIPSSALFRHAGTWAVFAVADGRAVLQPVEIGPDNGTYAQLLDGLELGAPVVLYPSADLADRIAVAERQVQE